MSDEEEPVLIIFAGLVGLAIAIVIAAVLA